MTRDRLRHAALALFAERGVDAVSQRDIAAAAGAPVSSLYTHWKGGRDQLIAELFQEGYADYARALEAAAAPHAGFDRALAAMIAALCRLHAEEPARFAFLLLSQHRALPALPEAAANPVEVLQRRVAAAIAAGEIPPAEPALITAAIVGILVQAATFRLYGRLAAPIEALVEPLTSLCFRAAGLPERNAP